MPKVQCKLCNKEFNIPQKRQEEKKGIYCSKECYNQSRKNTKTTLCKLCGQTITLTKNKVKLFCSKSCAAQYRLISGNKQKKCRMCNTLFYSQNIIDVFCSTSCKYWFNHKQMDTRLALPVSGLGGFGGIPRNMDKEILIDEQEYIRLPDPNLGF